MECIHMLKDLLKAGDRMVKIDLKDVYFMIPIAQEDREFQWKDKAYQFNFLLFRLSSAPWVFSKTKRLVVAGSLISIFVESTVNPRNSISWVGVTNPRLSSRYTYHCCGVIS